MPCDVVHHTGDLGHLGYGNPGAVETLGFPWFVHMKSGSQGSYKCSFQHLSTNSGSHPIFIRLLKNKSMSWICSSMMLMLKNFFRLHHQYGFVCWVPRKSQDDRVPHGRKSSCKFDDSETNVCAHDCNSSTPEPAPISTLRLRRKLGWRYVQCRSISMNGTLYHVT